MQAPPKDTITAAADVLGDRWTLLVLRDIMFEDRRHFRALLTGSAEGIASNILADRLVRLVENGLLTRGTAARGQRARYSLTEAGIRTVPILFELSRWGGIWGASEIVGHSADHDGDVTDQDLVALALMDDLRARHLGEDPVSDSE